MSEGEIAMAASEKQVRVDTGIDQGFPAGLAGATWRKSSWSTYNGNCVEVTEHDSLIGVRDSKDGSGPVLVFNGTAWRLFAERIEND